MTSAKIVTPGQASATAPVMIARTPSRISEVDVDLNMTGIPFGRGGLPHAEPSARDEFVRVCGIPSGDPSLASFRVKSSPSWTESGRPQYRNVTAPGRFVVCGGDAVKQRISVSPQASFTGRGHPTPYVREAGGFGSHRMDSRQDLGTRGTRSGSSPH